MDKDIIRTYGIEYEKGIKNCMGNEQFYHKILVMFLNDTCFQRSVQAYNQKDTNELFLTLHELKGISGNAALIDLYNNVVVIVEVLRNKETDFSVIDPLYNVVVESYNRAVEGIKIILAID